MPALVPAGVDDGASIRAFVAVHEAVITACTCLPEGDPALPALEVANTALQRWRAQWGRRDRHADIYLQYDAMVRDLEHHLADAATAPPIPALI